MTLSELVEGVIGLVSILWFVIRYAFTRTRCCVCDEKMMPGELKYRVTEAMDTDVPRPMMFARSRNPVCTWCMNKVPKSITTEIVCLNR